ncbi:MAG: sensor histidine kinase [Woeseiaceae bacterium]
MLRAPLAILAGASIVIVLSLLIIESRTVKDEYYVAHADRTRAIDEIGSDIAATLESMESAYAAGRRVPLSIESTFARLSDNNERLQSLADLPRPNLAFQSLLVAFDDELRHFTGKGRTFVDRQNTMAAALQTLQKEAPALVKELREGGSSAQSQLIFMLAIDLIEFASDQGRSDVGLLHDRIESARSDLAPGVDNTGRTRSVLDAAESIVDRHIAADNALAAVRMNSAPGILSAARSAVLEANREIVRRAERARLLLSVCAVLLLVGAAYTLVRLQASYRELNKSNAKLETANSDLEEQVAARTTMLSKANSDLKESQVQLIHAEKMSSLGQMVAGISHEINTPLWYLMNNSSVIQERLETMAELCGVSRSMITGVRSRTTVREAIRCGLSDMDRLLKGGIEDDIEEARSLIQDSISGLEDLTSLAQGLKDFSRLDRATHGQFDVNEGLDKALLVASSRIKNRITVHKSYRDVPPIYCSASQINQIFLNLLTNAADAISGGGDIVLQTWEEDGNVLISISDSGAGMPADVLPNILDPFFTTKEVGKGTGLGLSIVDQIVTKHDGEILIESEPGEGTCVTVSLPISKRDPKIVDLDLDEKSTPTIDVPAVASVQDNEHLPEDAPTRLSA